MFSLPRRRRGRENIDLCDEKGQTMRKAIKSLLAAAALVLVSGCGGKTADAEIKIPILEAGAEGSYKTAAAEYRDLLNIDSIGAGVEYAYSDTLSAEFDANLLSIDVKKNTRLNKGDVIAVFDSSALDYERQNQKILTDNAYARYASAGGEAARLEYEREAKKLELVDHKISLYTITAPYDCIVTAVERIETGTAVPAGTHVCTVAKPDEVYITLDRDREKFAFGMHVAMKFGTNDEYSGRVVMVPDTLGRGNKVLIAFDDGELDRARSDIGDLVSMGWATVLVKTVDIKDALCIPKDAVIQYSGATYCYYANDGSRTRIPIETGDTFGDVTVVLSGLSGGDMVSY